MTEPVRLAKRVAEISNCSRREAEILIEGGWVTVDGAVVREPQFRVAEHVIVIHPEAKQAPVELVTILLHQPAHDVNGNALNSSPPISPDNRASDDTSGINPLKRHFSKLEATMPLDINASGLMVYTQDWRVRRKLVDDARTVEQEYIVEVAPVADANPPDIHALKRLNHGLSFNGRALPPAKVSWQNETRLRIAVKGPAAGQIAHVCKCVGYQVRSIKRIRIGKISMAKLPIGQWRYLPPGERF